MADAIRFERQGDKVLVTIDLRAALAQRLSTGRPGSHGDAKGELDGKGWRVSLNAMQAGKVSEVVSL